MFHSVIKPWAFNFSKHNASNYSFTSLHYKVIAYVYTQLYSCTQNQKIFDKTRTIDCCIATLEAERMWLHSCQSTRYQAWSQQRNETLWWDSCNFSLTTTYSFVMVGEATIRDLLQNIPDNHTNFRQNTTNCLRQAWEIASCQYECIPNIHWRDMKTQHTYFKFLDLLIKQELRY